MEFAGQQVFGGVLLRGDDGSGWMTLLVFAVVIVLNVVAGLIKARKRKTDLQQGERPGPRPLAKPVRPPAVNRGGQQRPAARPVRPEPVGAARGVEPARPVPLGTAQPEAAGRAKPRTIVRPGSALAAFVSEIKAEIMGGIKEVQERKTPAKLPPQTDKRKAKAEPVRRAAPKPVLAQRRADTGADALSGIMPDFSGPDDLRRAIVYHEVLGKAVSLRQPGEHLIEP